ncbi:TIGR02300 family protein [Pelagibius sp. Alg239-R121]|uniref:TIGR02300 family protein n=1 Tax=Pelagibius sp. Alg239-R121 TaxID=2993448 RepID=UPI00345FAC8E
MTTLNRGAKHTCPECAIKYYDLGREPVVCPKCGSKPILASVLKTGRSAKRVSRPPSTRYP